MYSHSHQSNMRERRGGQQTQMGPQPIVGLPQTSAGVIMSMPNQPLHVMTPPQTQQQAQSQQSAQPGGGYVNQQHQHYNHSGPQVVLTKQAVNHNKHYRNMVRDTTGYNNYQGTYQQQQQTNYEPQDTCQSNNYNCDEVLAASGNSQKSDGEQTEECAPAQTNVTTGTAGQLLTNCESVQQTVRTNPSKEKTPMCLVNELARFNKISHQYRLTHEEGPAHEKKFTVTLNLGTEEYTSDGPSIKKAQHSAAAEALTKTCYQQPLPKTNKNNYITRTNVTPTVELNALAMKRGEPTVYKLLETQLQSGGQQSAVVAAAAYTNFRRPYGIRASFTRRGRSSFPRGGRMSFKNNYQQNANYTVSLKVGSYEFFGEGGTPQSARHDAAAKALNQLRLLPMPENAGGDTSSVTTANSTATATGSSSPGVAVSADDNSMIKSPISLVHEMTLKRNLNVHFEVVSEKGPPHMKVFVTKCVVGDLETQGEGNGKKVSKKRAAENMLEELKKLPPMSPTLHLTSSLSRLKRRPQQMKKKSRNLIKIIQQETRNETQFTEEVNPISRLIQIQQLKKEKEPVYTLIEEKGVQRRREFIMEVSVGHFKATGSGRNKKLAKKVAAQNLLQMMGHGKVEAGTGAGAGGNGGSSSSSSSSGGGGGGPAKPALKQDGTQQDMGKDRKVTFVEGAKNENVPQQGGSSGRQLVPGLLLMSDQQSFTKSTSSSASSIQATATMAKELLQGVVSSSISEQSATSAVTKTNTQQPVTHVIRPKDQLMYLADLLKFQVQFSDFPKGNHSEFLSLVSLSTDPPQVCHGAGPTIDESHDRAALTALRALSEMGLDSVTPAGNEQAQQPQPPQQQQQQQQQQTSKKAGKHMNSVKK